MLDAPSISFYPLAVVIPMFTTICSVLLHVDCTLSPLPCHQSDSHCLDKTSFGKFSCLISKLLETITFYPTFISSGKVRENPATKKCKGEGGVADT